MHTLSSRLKTLCVFEFGYVTGVPLAIAALIALSLQPFFGGPAEAKTPGNTYCFYGKCHRVKTIAETAAMIGVEQTLGASFYDSCKNDRYNPCGLTSSGEVFRAEAPDNAASPVFPDGTKLLVWSPDTGTALVMRVNNAGPYWGDRKLDVSRAAAEKLGFVGEGVATLKVRVLEAPTVAEATYKENRTYEPVPGFVGRYATADAASTGVSALMAFRTLAQAAGLPTSSRVLVEAQDVLASSAEPIETVVVTKAAPVIATAAVDGAAARVASQPDVKAAAAPIRIAALTEPLMAAKPVAVEETKPKLKAVQTAEADEIESQPSPAVDGTAHEPRKALRPTRADRVVVAKSRGHREGRNRMVASNRSAERQRIAQRQPITSEGTNDISVFSRHQQPGANPTFSEAQQRARRAQASALLARRSSDRDG